MTNLVCHFDSDVPCNYLNQKLHVDITFCFFMEFN